MTDRAKFHYLKSPAFRTVHVDGVLGGPSPSGFLNAAFFSERLPIPQTTTFAVTDKGMLGEELVDARVGRDGLTREVEVNLIMSVDMATRLHGWLGQHLKTFAEATAKGTGGVS
jgi:hypothetical protein